MNDRNTITSGQLRLPTPAALRLLLAALLTALLMMAGSGAAQALGDDAADALRQAQIRGAQAQSSYAHHHPDQPLWREAIELGERARRLAPGRPEPLRFLGQTYSVTGWHARAWEAWNAFLDAGGTLDEPARGQLADAATWLGYNAYGGGDSRAALEYYERAFELAPSDPDVRAWYGRILAEHGRAEEALPLLRELAERAPGDAATRSILERAEHRMRWGNEASDAFHAGLEARGRGELETALQSFRDATYHNPSMLSAFLHAGQVAFELNRPEVALSYWQQAAFLDPADAFVRDQVEFAEEASRWGLPAVRAFREGLAAFEAGDSRAARDHFRRATLGHEGYARAWAWLGEAELELGEPAAAQASFERAARLEPANAAHAARAQQAALLAAPPPPPAPAAPPAVAQPPEPTPSPPPAAPPVAEAPAEPEPAAEEPVADEPVADEPAPGTAEADELAAGGTAAEDTAGQAPVADEPAAEEPVAAEPLDDPSADEPVVTGPLVEQPGTDEPAAEEPHVPAAPARAEGTGGDPLTLLDVTYTHHARPGGGVSAFTFFTSATDVARDLRAPVDYAGGTLHFQIDVLEMPGEAGVQFQLCLVPVDILAPPTCSDASAATFHDAGGRTLRQGVASLSNSAQVDWTRGLQNVMIVVNDANGNPIDSGYPLSEAWTGTPDTELYFPLTVRYRAALVPSGGAFTGWSP